jgi:hypothetical protein
MVIGTAECSFTSSTAQYSVYDDFVIHHFREVRICVIVCIVLILSFSYSHRMSYDLIVRILHYGLR